MEIVIQNIKVYKTTINHKKRKLNFLWKIVMNITSRLPLFEGVENQQTLSERKRK